MDMGQFVDKEFGLCFWDTNSRETLTSAPNANGKAYAALGILGCQSAAKWIVLLIGGGG
jgi:hypothetical protein